MLSVLNVNVHKQKRPTKMRVYFFHQGETILDNLGERHHRPQREYRKLFTNVFAKVGIKFDDIEKIRWSQKAGCLCGCSPGFIVDGVKGSNVCVDVADTQLNLK